jgi:phosphoglycolate phosphatase
VSSARRRASRYPPVVFDLDGTLVDSRADLAAGVNRARARFALAALPVDAVVGMIGEGARRLVERAFRDAPDVPVDAALERFLADYAPIATEATRPYPGIPELLEALARERPLALLTNKPEAISRAILAAFGWSPHFAVVIGGDTLAARKPDPAGLRHIAAIAGIAVERLTLVGDTAIDGATARAAGCAFVLVEWGFAGELERRGIEAAARAATAEELRLRLAALADRSGTAPERARRGGSPASTRRR